MAMHACLTPPQPPEIRSNRPFSTQLDRVKRGAILSVESKSFAVTKIKVTILLIGIVCFVIPNLPVPSDVELPNTLTSAEIAAPDGRVYIANQFNARVQRYGPHGFERGFTVDSQGGPFDIGVSPSGNILICSARTRLLIAYDPDGEDIGVRGPCDVDPHTGLIPSPNYRPRADVPFIASSWYMRLAIPLWHPAIAYFMLVLGALLLIFMRPRNVGIPKDPSTY
jgi:hypothetical protein